MKPVKPREAQHLAVTVRFAVDRPPGCSRAANPKGLRSSTSRVLELLLRLADERHLVSRTTSFISRQLGLAHRTVERARQELRLAGLVHVVRPGDGRFATVYRVAIERIRELVRDVTVSTLDRHGVGPGTVTVSTLDRHGVGPQRAGARDARVLPLTPNPPSPQSTDAPEAVDAGGSPPAPPQPSTSNTAKCEHGRTSCRRCGTDRQSLAKVARERAKRAELEQARDRRVQREREEAAREPRKASEYLALSRAVKRGEIRPEDVPEPVNGAARS